jgi:hypothetical protein
VSGLTGVDAEDDALGGHMEGNMEALIEEGWGGEVLGEGVGGEARSSPTDETSDEF